MAHSNCELCTSTSNLSSFTVEPRDAKITICGTCKEQIENPAHIEGKVNGTHIVILTCFTKKA
jgi:ribosome-binding protein aMBF1 (putative translation factor)